MQSGTFWNGFRGVQPLVLSGEYYSAGTARHVLETVSDRVVRHRTRRMLVQLEKILSAEDVARVCAIIASEPFTDGRQTSAVSAKNNLQLPHDAEAAQVAGALLVERLQASQPFQEAVQPKLFTPPVFSRYDLGMEYPTHLDAPVMERSRLVRTDVAITVFLSDRSAYDGGELVIETSFGERNYTGNAGDCIAYPASMFHRVAKVTRGTRLAGVLWVQSTVRDPSCREILYELSSVLRAVRQNGAAGPYTDRLHRSYWNLVRLWAEV
jgi:PKHD-type hydroxylase